MTVARTYFDRVNNYKMYDGDRAYLMWGDVLVKQIAIANIDETVRERIETAIAASNPAYPITLRSISEDTIESLNAALVKVQKR